MAAGIGEATTILSVAQIGISLSKTLITYIEEAKSAPSHIRRIGNEILTTSERLKDIGEIVSQNLQTKVLNEEGINSAVRCSAECQQIINDVKDVLFQGGWQDHPKESDEGTVDTSLFATLKWPFVKVKLEIPRAELHRVKLDLSLLFSAAMVRGASTPVERRRLAQDIPELRNARAWAAKRAERVKKSADHRTKTSRARDVPWSDDEPEILEEFLTFKESLLREEEEKKIRERARIIQAEDEARRRKEEDAQHEVERKAIEQYQKIQREQETRSAEKRDSFRKELERLGVDSAHIQVVMESSNLDFQAVGDAAFVPEVRPSSSSRGNSKEQETTPAATSGWSRLNLPWWRSKNSPRESSSESPQKSVIMESSNSARSKLEFETWLLDFTSLRNEKIHPSADWLNAKMKTMTKDQDVWIRVAKLRPHWRWRLSEFLDYDRDHNPGWTLYYMELYQKRSRARLFGYRLDDQSMLLITCRQRPDDQDGQAPRPQPNIEGPGSSLPKHVTFAEGVREEAGVEEGFNATHDEAFAWNVPALREKIAKLELKRNGLGFHDQPRIADLDDMIDYLRNQLRSVVTPTKASSSKNLHKEHQSESTRSYPNETPVTAYEEYVPSSSRRDNAIALERRYSRGDRPQYRLPNGEDISVASRYPRTAYDNNIRIIDRVGAHNEWLGRNDYYDLDFSRNQSRYWPRERGRSYYVEDDIAARRSRNQDRYEYPRRGSPGWGRSPPRLSRQDSFDMREQPIVIQRDRSWERVKPQPTHPSRQWSKERDNYPDLDERIVRDNFTRPRERTNERAGWPSETQEIVIRKGSPNPTRRNRQHLSGLEFEHPYNDYGVRHGHSFGRTSGHSQALALRPGSNSLPYDYVRERVLNGGIRVRGENDIDSLSPEPAVPQRARRPYGPSIFRGNSHKNGSWAPSLQRRHSEAWRHSDSSEDEESRYSRVKRINSEVDNPETELSDAEVIAQTLKQFTTIQDSDIPRTGISTLPLHKNRASGAGTGGSAPKNMDNASAEPERKMSIPLPDRKAHSGEESTSSYTTRNDERGATNERSNPGDDRSFLDKISEGPDVMDEQQNDIPHHQRLAYFPQRPAPPISQERPSFPLPPDRAPSREASPGPQPRDPYLDSPRSGPIVLEYDGYAREETSTHDAQEEGYDDINGIRPLSRNPTGRDEVD